MNFIQLQQKVHDANAILVAVSKTVPEERILEIYAQGQRVFGENRVQEMQKKYESLPKDIEWHQIGHLQTNKVKYIAPFVSMIHAIDSVHLLAEVNKQAAKYHRVIDCLLQFHIAREETKFGFSHQEAVDLLEKSDWQSLQHVRICGVMGMASFTDNEAQIRNEFRALMNIYYDLKSRFFAHSIEFKHRSMGMSGDWELALEEGSTMVRVGSLIFGAR